LEPSLESQTAATDLIHFLKALPDDQERNGVQVMATLRSLVQGLPSSIQSRN
jgi:hypothetical protein